MSLVIETTIGDITVDLFVEERPVACLNFVKLCKLKYYNFNLFHTVEQGFIAQTGDPTGAGDGGSSVWGVVEGSQKRFFEAESLPKIKHSSPGLLSLVSLGKHLVGSQFFFTLGSDITSLDGIHCVIGEVVEGHETLRRLNEAIVDQKFRPFQDIRITHTVILHDPFPDPRGFRVPSRSPSPSAERMQNGRIAADEDIDDTGGKTVEEIQEMLAEREAKARATILEIVGDLPDAEMAPPENVLFICKLNPVTTDDDLEIIFSRFGKVKSCEVIRDKKTGDSLQYAFVEFEEQKSCEAAYFKMDNVLIDDRRIHVDFSQSVAKVKWRGKGRGVEGPEGRLDFNNLKKEDSKGIKKERNRHEGDFKRGKDSDRMTSEERIKAREERHREREHEARARRHERSKTRCDERSNGRRNRNELKRESWPREGKDYRDHNLNRNHETGNRRERQKRYSSERRHYERHSPDRKLNVSSAGIRRKEFSENHKTHQDSVKKLYADCIRQKGGKIQKSSRKKNRELSCDDSTCDSYDSSSDSTSETTHSTTASRSSENKKRRKRNTKMKRKVSKKTKKHKR